jgi:Mediator of RNA polymerase II transcription subunit 1
MASGGSTRTLIIAGSALALDIVFADNVVKKVSLSFPESPEIVTRHTDKAGAILLRDLEFRPNESPLTKMLDRFAANLERLAQLDKLSVIPSLNCHEAIAGIYESLEKLHNWEVERLREGGEMIERDGDESERTAMCTKSGKPIMHTRDRLGMSLDYWQEKRRLPAKTDPKTWSILVECAPVPAMGYLPIRVSENWISATIQKADPPAEDILLAPEHGPILDWLEPEDTILPSTDPPKPDAMEGIEQAASQKYPEVIFVAKFDPPVIVPYSLAAQIYSSTNVAIDMYQTTTFDGLMFPRSPEDKIDSESRIISREVEVPVFTKDGGETTHTHLPKLWVAKVDYGRSLTELPFSHPRQLVEMLPALRQYAFLSTLLMKSFGANSKPPSVEEKTTTRKSKKAAFAEFMAHTLFSEDGPVRYDVALFTQPTLKLQVAFPFRGRDALVEFEIKLNGVVEVVGQNILLDKAEDEGKGKHKALTVIDLGRILEITEDIGIWLEFVKGRLE